MVKTVAILGPGAVGGFLAAVLSKNSKVICIARDPQIFKKGIFLKSKTFGNINSHPKIVSQLNKPADALFITTKSYELDALKQVDKKFIKKAVVVPLLNGFEHIEVIRKKFGKKVAVGMISIEVIREAKNKIVHLSPHARIELASSDISKNRLARVAEILNNSGIETTILDSEAQVIWRKLVRLNAIAILTALTQKSVGFIRTNRKWRSLLEKVVKEASLIANKNGATIDPEKVLEQIDNLPANLSTSLAKDIAKGAQSELDSITGAIIRLAKLYKIEIPATKKIYDFLKVN